MSRVVHWQATAFTIVPALIAVPLGFIVGRAIFTAYADGIGAISDAAVPALIVERRARSGRRPRQPRRHVGRPPGQADAAGGGLQSE